MLIEIRVQSGARDCPAKCLFMQHWGTGADHHAVTPSSLMSASIMDWLHRTQRLVRARDGHIGELLQCFGDQLALTAPLIFRRMTDIYAMRGS